jgi:Histidine kinase
VSRNAIEAADAERQAIERTLHEGVQQDLVALAVRLQLARRFVAEDPAAAAQLLDEMAADVRDALERLRVVADQVFPSLLAPLGLPDALRAAGFEVVDEGIGRFDSAAEATLFFFCRWLGEQGSARLARDDSSVGVVLELPEPGEQRIAAACERVAAMGGTTDVRAAGGYVIASASVAAERSSAR